MNEQQLINSRRQMASKILQPIFDEIWVKVLEQMAKSPRLYPKVHISWTLQKPDELNMQCDEGSLISFQVPVADLPLEDIVWYAKDTVAHEEKFKHFEIHTDLHYRTERKKGSNDPEYEYFKDIVESNIYLIKLF